MKSTGMPLPGVSPLVETSHVSLDSIRRMECSRLEVRAVRARGFVLGFPKSPFTNVSTCGVAGEGAGDFEFAAPRAGSSRQKSLCALKVPSAVRRPESGVLRRAGVPEAHRRSPPRVLVSGGEPAYRTLNLFPLRSEKREPKDAGNLGNWRAVGALRNASRDERHRNLGDEATNTKTSARKADFAERTCRLLKAAND